MITYFTADTHFGHEKILSITWRDFPNIREHDETLLDGINRTVTRHDRLFILGDFGFIEPQKYRYRIRCKNISLIIGNHDSPKVIRLFYNPKLIHVTKSQGEKFVLCHYPMAYWPMSHRNAYHLYGHVHAQREETLDHHFPNRRSMDVGMDNAKRLLGDFRPFSAADVLSILGGRKGHDPVEFYKNNRGELNGGRYGS